MLRIEFIKKLSFTALLVSGIRSQVGGEPAKDVSSASKFGLNFFPTYPMAHADEIITSIVSKIYHTEMELDFFLNLFTEELKTRFPFEENTKVSNYKQLYSATICCEVVHKLVVTLVRVWQNLCLQFGLEFYGREELEADSIQIQNSILSFGNSFAIGDKPQFFRGTGETTDWNSNQVSFLVPWFGQEKTESILIDSYTIDIEKVWKSFENSGNTSDYNQSVVSEILEFTDRLIDKMVFFSARLHQYSVRFYYLEFVQNEFEKIQKKKVKTKDDYFWVRSISLESAIKSIKERAFHMQSGVCHLLDRQNQQMTVSSLIRVIDQISSASGGVKDVCKRLKLANDFGGILTVSTADTASQALPVLENAIRTLQKERNLNFP